MPVWLVFMLLVSIYTLPAKAIRFDQMSNMPRKETQAIRDATPWVEKLKLSIERDPYYKVLMKKLRDKFIRCKLKPTKGSLLAETEMVISAGNTEDDSLIQAMVKRAFSSTSVPQSDIIFDKRGISITFENSSRHPQMTGVQICLANSLSD